MQIMQMSTMQIIVGSRSNICFHCKIIYDKIKHFKSLEDVRCHIYPYEKYPIEV